MVKKVFKAILIAFGLFLLSQVPQTVFLVMKMLETNMRTTGIATVVVSLVIVAIFLFVAGRMNLFKNRKEKFFTGKNIGLILGVFVLMRVLLSVVSLFMAEQTANDEVIIEVFSGTSPIIIFTLICFVAPITEEIIMRGVLI